MKHLQNKTKKPSKARRITPIFEPRCQHDRSGLAAVGFMMYRRRNSALGCTRSNRRNATKAWCCHRQPPGAAGGGDIPLMLSVFRITR
jgi:hypothetical protein